MTDNKMVRQELAEYWLWNIQQDIEKATEHIASLGMLGRARLREEADEAGKRMARLRRTVYRG